MFDAPSLALAMKPLILGLIGAFPFIFFSCEEYEVDYALGEYFQEIATTLNDSAYALDSGETLCRVSRTTNKSPEAGKRVFLTYSYVDKKIDFYDSAVTIHRLSEILTGELRLENKPDTFPADPIRLESVWIGDHYLNMRFYFNYNSKPHSIGLLTHSTHLHSDTIRLYFTHDLNGDFSGYPVYSLLSFDLEKVLGSPERMKPLLVYINTSNYTNKEYYEFKY
jgi:hypothetical protein